MLGATVPQSYPNVRAYGATTAKGYSILLFNLDETAAVTVPVQIANSQKTSFSASQKLYGKAIYNASKNGAWKPPTTKSLGTVGTSFDVTLPAWSISTITLQ
jgi:hypothetical protein